MTEEHTPRRPYRKYDDGLTKQQRYVQRHREKVNAASAKWKRERRAKAKIEQAEMTDISATLGATSESVGQDAFLEGTVPGINDNATSKTHIVTEREDLPQNIDLRCTVEDDFNAWRQDLDSQISKFDKCWDIHRGWKAKKVFVGSRLEEFLRKKYDSADKLLRELEDVLKILTEKSPDWRLTIDRLIWVAGKQAEIERIFQHFYTYSKE